MTTTEFILAQDGEHSRTCDTADIQLLTAASVHKCAEAPPHPTGGPCDDDKAGAQRRAAKERRLLSPAAFAAREHADCVPQHAAVSAVLLGDSKVTDALSLHLDAPAIGSLLCNWTSLAEHMGMDTREIHYLHERIRYPHSPTVEVLKRFGNFPTGRLMQILRVNMKRLDVCAVLLGYFASRRGQALANSENGATGSSAVDSAIGSSLHRAATRSRDVRPNSSVLIVHCDDDTAHTKSVRWLCKNLQQYCTIPIVRFCEAITQSSEAADDCLHTVDTLFQDAYRIIIILSIGLNEKSRLPPSTGGNVDRRSVAMRHLLRNLQMEYIANYHTAGDRLVLCCVPTSGDVSGAPEIMAFLRSAVTFDWPAQQAAMFALVLNGVAKAAPQADSGGHCDCDTDATSRRSAAL